MIQVQLKRLSHFDLPLPHYQTKDSAGVDLYAALDEPLILEKGQRALIPTGIAIQLPPSYEAQIRPRSGLAIKNGISLVNSPGTIDADYRGEIKIILINHGHEVFKVNKGERVAQMVISPVQQVDFKEVKELLESERGEGGFGSTGR